MPTIQPILKQHFNAPTHSYAPGAPACSPELPSIPPLPLQPGYPTRRRCPGSSGGLNFHRLIERPGPAVASMATGVSRPLCTGKHGGIQFL